MKLKTKFQDEAFELGEVCDAEIFTGFDGHIVVRAKAKNGGEHTMLYDTLKEFNEEWEDYEEPKEHWYINFIGGIEKTDRDENDEPGRAMIEIGNYFETKEEAEKAVEKLKAYKKLKDRGFKFGECVYQGFYGEFRITLKDPTESYDEQREYLDAIDLLFGGEE